MLVIGGEYDMEPFTPKILEETFLSWYPNAELVISGNAAHYPQQETPVYVATVMNEFLARQI